MMFDFSKEKIIISPNNERTIKKGNKIKSMTLTQLNKATEVNDQFYQRLDFNQADQPKLTFSLKDEKIENKQDLNEDKEQPEIKEQQQISQNNEWINYFNKQNENIQLSDKILDNQDSIYEQFNHKQYDLGKFITRGGEGEVFEGLMTLSSGEIENVVCKIIFDFKEKEIVEEIAIMNSFEKNINIIKLIDSFAVSNNIYCFILEKCKHSLQQELYLISKKKEQMNFRRLIQMIFDLLNGLIQLRVYKILHLDIKPQNILMSEGGNCVFTDFGVSSIHNENKTVLNKGYTPKYAAVEQRENNSMIYSINYYSDIYSLGLTIQEIIDVYKINEEEEYKKYFKVISEFEKELKGEVIQNQQSKRPSCVQLHYNFTKILLECNESVVLLSQISKIKEILLLFPYDDKKDIPYYHQLRIYYYKTLIKIYGTLYKSSDNSNEIDQKILNISSKSEFTINEIDILSNISQSHHDLGLCQIELGKYQIALKNLEKSLEIRRIILFDKQDLIASSLIQMGRCQFELEDFQKALFSLSKTLEIRLTIFNKNHQDVATAYDYLGQCYLKMRDYEKSIFNLNESLNIRKQILDENHIDIAYSLFHIADYYYYKEDYIQSFNYLQVSAQKMCCQSQQDHYKMAEALNNFGVIYDELNYKKQSINCLLNSLDIFQDIFKCGHPEIVMTLGNIAGYYFTEKDYEMSLIYFLEAQSMAEKFLQMKNSLIIQINLGVEFCQAILGMFSQRKNLYYIFKPFLYASKITTINKYQYSYLAGFYYKTIRQYSLALKYFQETLDLMIQNKTINYEAIEECFNEIIECYFEIGDFTNYIKYELKLLDFVKNSNKNYFKLEITIYSNIAHSYLRMGDFEKAIQNSMASYDFCETYNQKETLGYAILLNTLADSYLKLQENKTAELYLLESLSIRKKLFNGNHFRIQLILNNLGQCYQQMNELNKSIKYQQESLQMNIEIHLKNHQDIATSLNNIGVSYLLIGQPEKGLNFLLDSFYMLRQLFKKNNHPFITSCLNNIGICYQRLGNYQKFVWCGILMFQIMSRSIQDPSYIYKAFLTQVSDMIVIKSMQ